MLSFKTVSVLDPTYGQKRTRRIASQRTASVFTCANRSRHDVGAQLTLVPEVVREVQQLADLAWHNVYVSSTSFTSSTWAYSTLLSSSLYDGGPGRGSRKY